MEIFVNKVFLIPMLATLVIVGLFSLPSATATTAGPSLTKVWDCDPSVTDHCFVVSFPETRVGIAIRFTVDVYVNYASDIPPTGTVSWSDGGAGGSFNSISCTLVGFSFSSPAASTCNITYTPTKTGSITITGTYSGDSNHKPSFGTSALTVSLRATKTTISTNPASTPIGTPIKFNAKIVDSGSGTKSIPTGTVSWSDGGTGGSFNAVSCALTQLGTSTSTSTCAIIYTPPANTGPVTITGTYSGDSTHKTSSGTSALTVNLRTTTTVVTPNPATGSFGDSMTFKAAVADTSGGTKTSPSGTVSWSDAGAGDTFNATCTPVATTAGKSACSVSYTPSKTGPITMTATYSGDATHASSSGTSALTVNIVLWDKTCQDPLSGTWIAANATCHINDLTLNQGTSLILNTGVCCLTLTI